MICRYHAFALRVAPARMYQRKTIFFLNPTLPVTSQGPMAAMDYAKPSTLCAVPYVLKLLNEQECEVNA